MISKVEAVIFGLRISKDSSPFFAQSF